MVADDLRVGIMADNPNFPAPWEEVVAKVRLADELGFDSVWLGETWGYDIVTCLMELVLVTSKIQIGAGIMNVFSRSPGVVATTAATLDARSNGRFLLGVGTSGPQVIEHWHGMPYEHPLGRLHDYIEIVNMVMRREPLKYDGKVFHLERGFKLRFTPVRDHIPIYVAALTPKSLEQAGAIADGVLPTFWPIHAVPALRATLDRGAASTGRPAGSAVIAPYLTTALIRTEEERAFARHLARAPIAWYIGRMGTFYADMLRRNGYETEVANVIAGWQTGPDAAAAAVTDAMLDATAIIGTPVEVAAGLRRWQAAGVSQPLIHMPPGPIDATGALLAELQSALAAS
jgi:F420-dependent oxidoreductase-like protein